MHAAKNFHKNKKKSIHDNKFKTVLHRHILFSSIN